MANIPVGGQIQIADNVASVDAKYGLYDSKQAAFDALGPDGMDVLAVGLTVGILEGGKVVEYWFESACDSIDDLVKKGGSTGGSTVSVIQTLPSGTEVAKITVDVTEKTIYAPTPTEGGGSSADVINNLNPDSTTSVLSAA